MTKRSLRLLLLTPLALGLVAWYAYDQSTPIVHAQEADVPTQGFALVELFTSEGCSSCPPADDLLGEIRAQADQDGLPVYTLAFHVDYWDDLGWPDPYAQRAFTLRQRLYARGFRSERIYTPQMIVNGTEEFVGSSRSSSRAAIAAALALEPRATLTLQLTRTPDHLEVHYTTQAPPTPAKLLLALTQRHTSTDVPRGENGGRTLQHHDVVRHLTSLDLDAPHTGTVQLPLPPTDDPYDLVGFVQQLDFTVLSAARLDVPRAE